MSGYEINTDTWMHGKRNEGLCRGIREGVKSGAEGIKRVANEALRVV